MFVCLVTSVVSDSLRRYGLSPIRQISPWDSPGNNTEVGCHALLQGIFPTQDTYQNLDKIFIWEGEEDTASSIFLLKMSNVR